ncbi:DinB family protein [Robertkochia marina]|uniref:DinB family protein n=1 Tax=Robertkochia marina TaxID=1227945 RepID=A0A4S3M3P9_9FLAO|nr:DinB family protein [Robertkochia marina]THD69385.1 DinB family protein [Robertkochia marina]TRZ47354.1 DinB family protein [Robertkochia marina]
MKTKMSTILLIVMCLTINTADAQQGLTKEERKKAINLYDNAMAETDEVIEGLSAAQLRFKPTEDSWSIADCIEHLTLTEDMFMQMIEKSLETPADEAMKANKKFSDKEVFAMITNRDQKMQTQEPLEPSGKWGTTKETMKAFKSSRKQTANMIKKTDKDLRNHYFEFPFGTVDTYQLLIFGAGHQKRHNAQIMEIKNHPDFPTS